MKPTKKEKMTLDPKWFSDTAKLAMKRGTAIVFAKNRTVYGILPKGGGSVNVFYQGNDAWVDMVLGLFPNGAVFPFDNMFGGPATAKALRAYANLRLPEDGSGSAWIDPITHVLHIKGSGATIHSATFEANEMPTPAEPREFDMLSFGDTVPKDIGKLLIEFTRRDENRPYLKRIYGCDASTTMCLGSTDGRSAIMHGVGELPYGFSFDPTLVNMYDIVGYRRDETPTGAAIHSFRLTDGTTFVEKIVEVEAPPLPALFEKIRRRGLSVLLAAAQARKLDEEIATLGLGANDTWGGVLLFTGACVAMQSNGQPVAEFACAANLQIGEEEIRFATPLLSRIARLGGDMCLAPSPGLMTVGYCKAGSTEIVAAPISLPPPQQPQTGASA